jgi:outer membrane protein assembly factor BamB
LLQAFKTVLKAYYSPLKRVEKIMERKFSSKIMTAVLLLLMTSMAFVALPNPSITTANAQTTPSAISSNLLQYEYIASAGGGSRAFFTDGPAPNSPNILWKAQIPNAGSGPVAFNGLIFVQDASTYYAITVGSTYALDATTGELVWTVEGLVGPMTKLDDTYMMVGNKALKISDGTVAWTAPAGVSSTQGNMNGVGYVSEVKMFFMGTTAWSLPDASQPPTLAWNRTDKQDYGSESPVVYGDGVLVVSTSDSFIRGIDATNGNTLWTTPTKDIWSYGSSYIDGKIVHGGLDGYMNGWDIHTGKLLWSYEPPSSDGFPNQFASATAAAYGIVYEHNQNTYIYAVNASNGQLLWKQKGPGVGYSNTLSVADGKVYLEMGDNQYRDPITGEYAHSEYDCFDAYTGQLIWSIPMECGAPFNLQCVAYGNLYVIPSISTSTEGWTYTGSIGGTGSIGEVWCISNAVTDWPMYQKDGSHSADGAGPTDLALNWQTSLNAAVVSSPTIVNGVCYIGSLDKNIYAINAATGTEIWNFATGFGVRSTVAVANNKVYTGADDGNVYCLDASSGSKIWSTPVGFSKVGGLAYRSSPMIANGELYIGSIDGNLYCLNTDTGAIQWKVATGGAIYATPAVVGGAVYINPSTYPDGTLLKLDGSTGAVLFNVSIPYSHRSYGAGDTMIASPTVANGVVFVRTGLYTNYALNATTGDTLWEYKAVVNEGTPQQNGGTTQICAMLYKYGIVYLNDFYGITALNAANGSVVWQTYLARENIASGLSYSYGRIYTVNENGVLYVLDAITGQKLSYWTFPAQMHSMPTSYNGSLYIATNDWNLYCFGDARLVSAVTPEPSPKPTATPAPIEVPTSTPEPTTTPTTTKSPTQTPASTVEPTSAVSPEPQQTATPAQESKASSSDTTLYIAIGAIVVIVVIAAAALLLRKRK